ncbi:MAG TPA: FKBP-type peptidyl-prolyl cis-trans isomerase [Candidatus Paceibacterota bacterium]|jgi:peptidylprolyl isomerase|nr:FKBP-type peptidyl-prolyl cis-trans isomerase [Candidatus Paceibacterota bacterium]
MNPTHTGIAVALALVVALGFLAFGTPFFASFSGMNPVSEESTGTTTNPSALPMDLSLAPGEALPTDLVITDVVVGSGAEAQAGQMVTVNYVGALPDGTVFDASANHGQPFAFQLGAGQVIRGWDEGVAGMKVGGKRRLVIPPDMAYGAQAVGGVIPANATLLFEVELLAVQ